MLRALKVSGSFPESPCEIRREQTGRFDLCLVPSGPVVARALWLNVQSMHSARKMQAFGEFIRTLNCKPLNP